MFNFMLKNKRGFTLVELLVVVLLMGFGAVALMNLFQVALKTFNAAEERYIKQEMVKEVSEYLQNSVTVISATMAEVYPDASVVPTTATNTDGYAYIYVEKQDRDGDGKLDGYYLYILNPGESKATAEPLNKEAPIYISIDVYEDVDEQYNDGKNDYDVITNQCGVKFRIAAVDERFNYMTEAELQEQLALPENAGKTTGQLEAELIEDNIFYDVDVSYHFPNMVDRMDKVRVNLTSSVGIAGTKYELGDDGYYHDIGFTRTKTDRYTEGGVVIGAQIESVDTAGKALRVTTDTTITGEGAAAALNVSSFCFIATAGYGEATGEVGILCDFRDQCLKTNPLGRMFVKAYYTVSPPIADFIAEHETLKAATRVALKPLVAVAVYALEPELLIDELPFVIMGIVAFGGIVAVAVVSVKRRKAESL